jgi:uncharacterized protein
MSPALPAEIAGEKCWLSPERCLFWESAMTLVVSDLHFGKTGHFRREGIAIPQTVYQEDLHRLMAQIQYFKPRRIIFTGDLFHSVENSEHALFARWRTSIDAELILVRGNHDILSPRDYEILGISTHAQCFSEGVFDFVHDPAESQISGEGRHRICGHLHPGIRLSGMGKQSLRLSCFYSTPEITILPAFSKFTGLSLIDLQPGDKVFAVLPANPRKGETGSVIRIQ